MKSKKNTTPGKNVLARSAKKATGKRAVMLGVTADQHELLQAAAALELRPVTQFVIFHSLREAERIIILEATKRRASRLG